MKSSELPVSKLDFLRSRNLPREQDFATTHLGDKTLDQYSTKRRIHSNTWRVHKKLLEISKSIWLNSGLAPTFSNRERFRERNIFSSEKQNGSLGQFFVHPLDPPEDFCLSGMNARDIFFEKSGGEILLRNGFTCWEITASDATYHYMYYFWYHSKKSLLYA